MEHLAQSGVRCPTPVHDREGRVLQTLSGKPAAIVTFLPGYSLQKPQPAHCRAVGAALAALHEAGRTFARGGKTRFRFQAGPSSLPRSEASRIRLRPGMSAQLAQRTRRAFRKMARGPSARRHSRRSLSRQCPVPERRRFRRDRLLFRLQRSCLLTILRSA